MLPRVLCRLLLVTTSCALVACGDGAASSARDASDPLPPDAGGGDGSTSARLPEDFDRALKLTTLSDLDEAPDVVEVALEAKVAAVEIAPGQWVEAWTYDGAMPGPTIRAKEGDLVRVHFTNSLPEATTIHWHGVEVPADQDGAAHGGGTIPPGGSFDYAFRVPHAGTYWYHPHVDSAAQVWRGLYGALIVDAPAEPDYGDELTLLLHDQSHQGGRVSPAAEQGDLGRYFGHEGATVLVNGRVLPTVRAYPGSSLRIRVINAAITRYFRFAVDGHPLLRVAGDSGPIERVQSVSDHVLAPGERSEFVLTLRGTPGDVPLVRALAHDRFACGGHCSETRDLLRIELVAGTGRSVKVASEQPKIAPIDVTGANQRVLELGELTRGSKTYLTIDGRAYGEDTLELEAHVGATEVWTIKNLTEYDHPFHLHGFRFQVLDVIGRAPVTREWKDTINVVAKSDVRFAVFYDDRPGMWMFHCHILDHADLGMMGVLRVGAAQH